MNNSKMILLGCLLGTVFLFSACSGEAAERIPAIALMKQSQWPDTMQSRADFDRASRAEILIFLNVLEEIEQTGLTADALLVDAVSFPHVKKWIAIARYLGAQNLAAAAKTCAGKDDLGCLSQTPSEFTRSLPPRYQNWKIAVHEFLTKYCLEVLHGAAIFPEVSNEVLRINSREITGEDWPDAHFLLTFDDGPTVAGGITDRIISFLEKNSLTGVFFLIGNSLQERVAQTGRAAVKKVYKNQCVGLHAKQHDSFVTIPDWKESFLLTQVLIADTFGKDYAAVYYRPTFGERNETINQFAESNGLSVMMWNLNSRDWESEITGHQVADRIINLMLLWRRGIILFHDTHPRALVALPQIVSFASGAQIVWKDCRE